MTISFKFAALHFLNMWLDNDSSFYEMLSSGDKRDQLTALRKISAEYKIARTLPKQYEDNERLLPVWVVIDPLSRQDFENDIVTAVSKFRDKISSLYGGRQVLSAATKFLWFKVRSPVIMYDRQVQRALGTKEHDLAEYYQAWRARFEIEEQRIDDACRSLVNVRDYAIDSVSAERVKTLSAQQWFRERVLDMFLWHVGR